MSARPLVFATRNRGKVVEDEDTFAGNAAKKAREVSAATGLPALADDSGLEVDHLGGAPGVISARWAALAGEGEGDAANNAKLLRALAGVPAYERNARFRSSLALADVRGALGPEVLTADGVCEGLILDEPRGTGGFGYDPLFWSPELDATFAEAGVGPKSGVSHRARAMHALAPQLVEYLRSC